ncbi:MAG: hypothetical protein F6J89_19955, partial [Symploca sp. SIO1C4]|nr:hypothetical protein [Symploca sp. SIO1C4]
MHSTTAPKDRVRKLMPGLSRQAPPVPQEQESDSQPSSIPIVRDERSSIGLRGKILLGGGLLLLVGMTATSLFVTSSQQQSQQSATAIDVAINNKNIALREYLELLTRTDLGVNEIRNPGLLQQQYSILAQEFLRDVTLLRQDPSHPSFRLTEQAALQQQTQGANKMAWLAQQGVSAQLTYSYQREEGGEVVEKTVTVG